MTDRVQSVDRAFSLLELIADTGGSVGLSELAAASGLPLPTIHRLLRSLVSQGYVRQEASRRYALGPRLIRLGESASRMLGSWAIPYLTDLVNEIGETANMAMLDGESVVYVAQVASPHSMRMFTEVGRRVLPHSTGVGKALLSTLSDAEIRAIVAATGMPARTEKTLTTPQALLDSLAIDREVGYSIDDGEQELGVRCVAVPVENAPVRVAISVSGPDSRVPESRVHEIAPVLQRIAEKLVADLRASPV
ncbi:MAG: IclR family transcriptional regulator [Nocardioidaceae bacterium]